MRAPTFFVVVVALNHRLQGVVKIIYDQKRWLRNFFFIKGIICENCQVLKSNPFKADLFFILFLEPRLNERLKME